MGYPSTNYHQSSCRPAKRLHQVNDVHAAGDFLAVLVGAIPINNGGRQRLGQVFVEQGGDVLAHRVINPQGHRTGILGGGDGDADLSIGGFVKDVPAYLKYIRGHRRRRGPGLDERVDRRNGGRG